MGILIFHKLWLCLHLPRAGSTCMQTRGLVRAQHSRLAWAASWFLASKTQSKLLKIHSNKLFFFSTTTLQRDAAMIVWGTMISTNHFLVCTKNFSLLHFSSIKIMLERDYSLLKSISTLESTFWTFFFLWLKT